MLRRNKRTNRQKLPVVEVNIISLMDILTTLLFFLIMFVSFSKFSVLDASALLSGKPTDDNKPIFSLRVDVYNPRHVSITLGPIKGLKMVNEGRLRSYLNRRFSGSGKGFSRKIYARNKKELVDRLQNTLVEIKKSFPHEHKIVALFNNAVQYQQVVDMVGGMRELSPARKGFSQTDLLGKTEKSRVLFPEVIVGEAG